MLDSLPLLIFVNLQTALEGTVNMRLRKVKDLLHMRSRVRNRGPVTSDLKIYLPSVISHSLSQQKISSQEWRHDLGFFILKFPKWFPAVVPSAYWHSYARDKLYMYLQWELLSLNKCYVEEGLNLFWTFQQIDLGLMDNIESGQIVAKHKMSLLTSSALYVNERREWKSQIGHKICL